MYVLHLMGRYRGQVLTIDDTNGAAGVADGWLRDLTDAPYPYDSADVPEQEFTGEVPESYTTYINSVDDGTTLDPDNPDGGGGDEETAPTLTSLDPVSAPIQSGDVTVTITGSGFTESSVLVWNGTDDVSEFVAPETITTVVKTNLAAEPSTCTVAVRNGAKTSNELTFELAAAAEE